MDATTWAVIGMGVTILIAIAAQSRHLDSQAQQTREQIAQLRERMAKLEGLLEGLREAITSRRAA